MILKRPGQTNAEDKDDPLYSNLKWFHKNTFYNYSTTRDFYYNVIKFMTKS